MNASQILARALADRGVRHVYGMPGGVTLPILDALREVGVDFVLVRDEASAGFMADAAWSVTGAPGVCLSTLGPGATNLVSGVAGALLDRSEIVAITGQIAGEMLNVYTHQTLDQSALFAPITKRSVTLTAARAWQEIPLALRQLSEGRRGPVHLNVPGDVATAEQPGALLDAFSPAPALAADASPARAALSAAERPLILAGLGDLSDAAAVALRGLAEATGAPVLTSYKAKGLLPEDHPLSIGACGLSPEVDAIQQALVAQADLLILVGLDPVELRPNWLPGWPAETPVIAIDRAAPTDLLCPISHLLVGDVPLTLAALTEGAAPAPGWPAEALEAHRASVDAIFDEGDRFGPASAIRALQAGLPEDAIVALDVGAHRITASHVWRCAAPQTLLQSNGFSSMGYGLPAALAAKLSRPERAVACLSGDMGLWMTLGELGVAQERRMDLVVVYLADRSLSLIELKQERKRYASSGVRFSNPDVEALGRAFGGVGVSVADADALREAAREGVARGGLTLVEATIDPAPYRAQM